MTKRIGLLGRLREHYGMNVLVAQANTRRTYTATLYGELAKAMFLCRQKRVKLKAAIADLVRRGAQAVILGCTGVGTLPEAGDSSVPLIGTTLETPGCGQDGSAGVSCAGPERCLE